MKSVYVFFAILCATGCATQLETFDSNGEPSVGIPVPQARLVKVTKTTSYEPIPNNPNNPNNPKNPELCKIQKVVESYDYIASDAYYYVNFHPSQFAKGDFEITFNDEGLATKISVNSEANTGLDSVNSLLGTALPFYKATKAEELAAEAADSAADINTKNTPFANLPTEAQEKLVPAADLKAASCIETKTEISVSPLPITQ